MFIEMKAFDTVHHPQVVQKLSRYGKIYGSLNVSRQFIGQKTTGYIPRPTINFKNCKYWSTPKVQCWDHCYSYYTWTIWQQCWSNLNTTLCRWHSNKTLPLILNLLTFLRGWLLINFVSTLLLIPTGTNSYYMEQDKENSLQYKIRLQNLSTVQSYKYLGV